MSDLGRSFLVLGVLAVLCGACANANGSYVATRGGLMFVQAAHPRQDELDRCEATGMSHQRCCDNHLIDPCP